MATITNSLASRGASAALAAATANSTQETSDTKKSDGTGLGEVATKEAFLKLLVAQIKNQNPLNPADGVQFLTQLAQFSELEQMMEIRADVEALRGGLETPQGADGAQG